MLIILIIFLPGARLAAQNYRTVNPDRTGFFINEYNSITSLRIDSVSANGDDTMYYPMKNIQEMDWDCFSPYAPSWIGEKIIIKDNDYNVFFNRINDSIKIKTSAGLGEEWLCYMSKDSLKIYATVTNLDTLSFLGVNDSVKTISFQACNKDDARIEHTINDKKVKLSRNHGLVKTLSFFFFPDLEGYYFYDHHLQEFSLSGLTNPKIGIDNLAWKEVYDFDVGDEIHVYYEDNQWGTGGYDRTITIKSAIKYLQKELNTDSIIYLVERKWRKETLWSDSSKVIIKHDTTNSIITDYHIFNKLPGEPIFFEYEAYSYSMGIDHGRLSKTEPSKYSWIMEWEDTCWFIPAGDDCWPDYTYIEGLGCPYYWCEFLSIGGEMQNNLVYYKKGGETWGNPYVISDIEESNNGPPFELYPNPVNDILFIKTTQENIPYSFSLWDLSGKLLFESAVEEADYCLTDFKLSAGLYYYRIINKSGRIKSGKLVFE